MKNLFKNGNKITSPRQLKGANLPKDLNSLIGKYIYFRATKKQLKEVNSRGYFLSIEDLTPNKYYKINALLSHDRGETMQVVSISDDVGFETAALLGKHACASLGLSLYWSIANVK